VVERMEVLVVLVVEAAAGGGWVATCNHHVVTEMEPVAFTVLCEAPTLLTLLTQG
jgi:hypothetical protein